MQRPQCIGTIVKVPDRAPFVRRVCRSTTVGAINGPVTRARPFNNCSNTKFSGLLKPCTHQSWNLKEPRAGFAGKEASQLCFQPRRLVLVGDAASLRLYVCSIRRLRSLVPLFGR